MHEMKIITHPLLEFYFPNQYIHYNEEEMNVLGIRVMINTNDISYIFEITEVIVKSYLAAYEKMKKHNFKKNLCNKKAEIYANDGNFNANRISFEKLHNNDIESKISFRYNNDKNIKKIKYNENKHINFNRKNGHQYINYRNKSMKKIDNPYKNRSNRDDHRFIANLEVNNQLDVQNISNNKIESESIINSTNPGKGDFISCINVNENSTDTSNYSKIIKLCKINGIEFPEFMIEKQNDVYFCKTEFLNQVFTSRYHYEKNTAKEEACKMMINSILSDNSITKKNVQKNENRVLRNH